MDGRELKEYAPMWRERSTAPFNIWETKSDDSNEKEKGRLGTEQKCPGAIEN